MYLRNRSPTKAVDGMTPFEAWNKVKPDVGHLRVFGCLCYAHIPKDERQKLDVKARKCIMLGYGTETKAYRLMLSAVRLFSVQTLHVFNEAKNGIEKEPASSQSTQDCTRYVQLDSAGVDDQAQEGEQIPQEQVPQEQEPGLRRSTRERRQTNFYTLGATCTVADIRDPLSRKEALDSGSSSEWVNAMEKEMESLLVNEVWDLVELPKDRKAVGSKWVFKTKRGANGAVERHKARLVAQGYLQQYGQDYDETFSPVVRFESLRTVIAFAVQHGLELHQMDVTTAFLNGELKEEVYMRQPEPEGFAAKGKEDLVCKLKKSIYGLKQSPRCWNSALDNYLKELGFSQVSGDPCPS